jgi:hypothetical protein
MGFMPQVVVAALTLFGNAVVAVGAIGTAMGFGIGVGALAAGAAVVIGGVMVAKRVMSLFEVEMPTVDTDVSRQRTVKSTTEPQKIIYGEALVSGPISFIGLSGTDNSDLYQTIVLAGHEVTEITDIHMDDVVISNADINGGAAAGGAVGSGSVEFGPKNGTICVINKYKGEASQTADPLFTAAFSTGPASNQYTSAHRGDGIAYLAMKWVLNEDSAETWEKFSPSNVKALVKGKPVYDPRLDTGAPNYNPLNQLFITYNATAGSYVGQGQNPALVLADYLISDLGMGISPSKIDWSSFITAANGCDVSVNVPNNGTEKRFTCNGVLFTTDSHQKNINKILSSMNGNLVYSNGKYIVHAGIYEDETIQEPFETLNEDDLIGAISIKTSLERSDRFNTIKGLFIDPSQNHKSTEFPKVQLADAVARDNDEILEKEVQYPMTNSSYMAQRLSFKLIKLSDQQKIISFPANLSALRITAGDRVKVSIEELSWSDKIFQCVGWNFSEEGGVNLTLREDSESAYDDPVPNANPALSEYSTITATGDITDAFRGVPSPSGLTVTPGLKSNELNWVNPGKTNDFGTIYVYASRNANFSSAIKIGETDGTQFIHDASNKSLVFSPSVVNVGDTYTIRTLGNTDFTAMGAASNTVGVVFTATSTGSGTGNLWETMAPGNLRYYWVRAVKNVGTDAASQSNLEPNADPNTTVFATVGAVEVDWDNVADPTIGIDINNDTISINTGFANTTTGQAVATSGIEAGTTVTQGGITMNQGGSIKGGQSAYNSGTGFFLGYDTNAYKFSIGNAGNNSLAFDGTNLAVTGAITATSGTFTGTVNASAGEFTGSVSIGSTGAIYGGTMSSFNSGSGFFLGYDTDAYKFSVGNSSSKVLTWDGDNLNIQANLVSFTTAKEQVYSSLSRLPPGVVSAARSLGSNSDYFYFDSDIDVIQPSFVVSYKLGALTSGSISGQANSRNAIVSTVKLELFYATASYSGTPGTWTSWRSRTFTSSTLGVGQPSMSDNTIVVRQFDLGGGNWETKLLTREEYREYQEDDYYSPSFTPNNAVDDEYYLNWRVDSSSPTVDWPVGAKFIKVVATITNGSYTPYPSTGSPSTTETRVVSIPGGTLYEHENYGSAIALGGQAWDNATRYIGLSGQTNISGGEIIIGAGIQNPAQVGDTATLKFVGFDEDGGSSRKLSAIEFHNGISTLSGTPDFQIFVPNAGNVLAFAGDVNFNSDVDVDGTLSINGVTVNAGAVTGPAGSNTQVQFNNNGALGGSSGFTFNDSNDTLTVSNLTVSGTTTTVNTDNLTVKDPNITLNYATGDSSSTANNAGITIQDAVNSTTDASILWKTASDTFEFSHGVTGTTGTFSGRVQAQNFGSDDDAKFYVWRALENTSSQSTNYKKIARVTGGQSQRFMITLTGRNNSYGDGSKGSKTEIYGQLNNDSNYDLTYTNYDFSATGTAVTEVGYIDVSSNVVDIYVKVGSFSELAAYAVVSDGTLTPATDSATTTAPTGYTAATSNTIWTDSSFSSASITSWDSAYSYSQVGHLPLAGGTLSGNLSVTGSVDLGGSTDGSRRFKWYNDANHTLYYNANLLGTNVSADVLTYYESFVIRHQDTTNAVIVSGSSGNIKTGGSLKLGNTSGDVDGVLHVYNAGSATSAYIDNRKTYGTGTGIADKAELILSLSENDTSISAAERPFVILRAQTRSETDSANALFDLQVRTVGNTYSAFRAFGDNNALDFPINYGNGVSDLTIGKSFNNTSSGLGFATRFIGVNVGRAVNASNMPYQNSTFGGITGASAIALNPDDNSYGQIIFLTSPQDSSANTELSPRMFIKGNGDVVFNHQVEVVGNAAFGSYGVFSPGSIDPDSFSSYAGGFGTILDLGWGVRGLFVHGGGTGAAAAIGHNGSNLYFGIQNGSTANSMSTWMQVSPSKAVDMTGAASVALPTTTSGAITASGNISANGGYLLGTTVYNSGNYTVLNNGGTGWHDVVERGNGDNYTVKALGGFKIANTVVIDSSRNLTNIGTISSGAITSTGTSAINNFRLTDSSKLGFGTVLGGASVGHTATVDEGIFWHTDNGYGIYRTSGDWITPNYQQLKLNWLTGIIIDGGAAYGLSGVDIKTSGTSRFKVNASGSITVAGAITSSSTISASGRITSTSNTYEGGIWLSPSSGSAYITANRASDTTGQVGFGWYTGATMRWVNYLPQDATHTLHWYSATTTTNVMTLGTSGNLTVTGTISSGAIQSSGSQQVSKVFTIPNTGGSNLWIKLGNFACAQSGWSITLRISTNAGYNAGDPQNSETFWRFKSSNNSSNQNGFYGDSQVYKWGPNATPSQFRVVQLGLTSFDLWAFFSNFTGDGSFVTVNHSTGTWTNSMTTQSTDPGGLTVDIDRFLTVDHLGSIAPEFGSNLTLPQDKRFISAPNSTWSNSISFGGNGNNVGANQASVATTNGNLHLDPSSTSSRGTYLNWYAGQFVYIGNGAGAAAVYIDGTNGNINAAGNITAYGSPSDLLLKENIEVIPDALAKVKCLRGVTFNYKKDGGRSTGLIAQELQEVLPEVVYVTEDIDTKEEHLAVRYGNVVGLLVEAIKELTTEVEYLKLKLKEK